jgi:hypothetical protein
MIFSITRPIPSLQTPPNSTFAAAVAVSAAAAFTVTVPAQSFNGYKNGRFGGCDGASFDKLNAMSHLPSSRFFALTAYALINA